MSEIVKCIAQSITNCYHRRKLIRVDSKRVAITAPTSIASKGKTYIVALYINDNDIPLIMIRRCVNVGSSLGFIVTSPVLRKMAEIPNLRVKVCIAEINT